MDQIQSMKAFVTVVRLQSFTKAARQLNTSLASLSRAVSSLESHTRTHLVNRSSRFVSLAPGAREYFDICVEVLDRLHEGEQRLLEDRAQARGVLRIAAHPVAIEAGLSRVVGEYQRSAPEVEIVLNTHSVPMRLEHDRYDVAVYPPGLILDAEAICRRVLDSPIVLVASPDYLSRTGFDDAQEALGGHVILSCHSCHSEPESEHGIRLEREGQMKRLSNASVRMSVSGSTAIQLALSGFGMALLPEFLVTEHLLSGSLIRPFPDHRVISQPASLAVAYVRHGVVPQRTRNFIDTCTRLFAVDVDAASVASRVGSLAAVSRHASTPNRLS